MEGEATNALNLASTIHCNAPRGREKRTLLIRKVGKTTGREQGGNSLFHGTGGTQRYLTNEIIASTVISSSAKEPSPKNNGDEDREGLFADEVKIYYTGMGKSPRRGSKYATNCLYAGSTEGKRAHPQATAEILAPRKGEGGKRSG